jgi:hypothetical protein
MPKIKGPLRVNMNGRTLGDLIKEKAEDLKNSLPFTATGWKSEKNSDLVPGGAQLKERKVTEVKEVKAVPVVSQEVKSRGRPKKTSRGTK